MIWLELWVHGAPAKALGWTLVHSLWEGAAVALALAIVLAVARSSRLRYWAACAALLGILAMFGATFYKLAFHAQGSAAVPILPAAPGASADDGPVANLATPWDASDLLPWLAPVWIAGVMLFQLRYLASWIAAGRLRRTGVFRAPDFWIETLEALRARLRISRPVALLESCVAEVPVVAGHLRPVILMPLGLLTGLPRGQIESILLHELAHIARADYLVNLMQSAVEGLLFYHPAVWWISSVIRAERENCCDDIVVATNGNAHEYATALAALAENRFAAQTALAATGGSIVKRVRRLLVAPESPRTALAPLFSAGVLVVTCAITMVAWQAAPQSSGPSQAAPAASAKQKVLMQQLRELAGELWFQRWLREDVAYIITKEERKAFLNLRTDAERDQFIKQFWARRDPAYPQAAPPGEYPVIAKGDPNNAFRTEHYRRIAYANDHFKASVPGWKTDRGRIYIVYGPPDEIESHPKGEGPAGVPFEQWKYRYIEGIGTNVILEFVDTNKTDDFRLTVDPNAKAGRPVPEPLSAVFTSAGPGEKAIVVVSAGRSVKITLPINYDATELSAQLQTASSVSLVIRHEALTDPCQVKSADSGCNYVRTMLDAKLDPGTYVFSASVTSGGAAKTYVVNFSVH